MPDFDRIRVLLHSDGLLHWEPGLDASCRHPCEMPSYHLELHWEPGGIFRTTCDINIAYFPFDSQRCLLLIGAYSYHSSRMNITNASRAISTHDFSVNGEWHIISTSAEYGVTVLSPPPPPAPDDDPTDRHVDVVIHRECRASIARPNPEPLPNHKLQPVTLTSILLT